MMNKNISLLATLKMLYSRLAMIVLNIRLNSYHFLYKLRENFDIKSVLNQEIDKLVSNPAVAKSDTGFSSDKVQSSKLSPCMNKIESTCSTESEFSKHLKKRKSSSIIQPHIGDKLKKSAWEHIHASIRCAKQGSIKKAKLHADIAGNAIEEAGHFMNDSDYSDLVCKVEKYFNES